MAVVAPDSPPSVLVVDDDRDTVTTMVVLLQQGGFQVESAHNGITALTLAETLRFDLILLDLGMPRLDGYAVARAIRQVQEPSPLLVAVSGYGQPDDVIKCAAAGFDLHLLKPVNTTMLAELPVLVGRAQTARETTRRLAAEHTVARSALLHQSLTMGNTCIDLAIHARRLEDRNRLLSRAQYICGRIAAHTEYAGADAPALDAAVALLRHRIEVVYTRGGGHEQGR
jgi:CheY-like chemotaxis protein